MVDKPLTDALILLIEIEKALDRGMTHYRKSDNKILGTPKEIIEALIKEGELIIKLKEE